MANFDFKIGSNGASLAPYSVVWRDLEIGVSHAGAPLYSTYKEVDLYFDSASITMAKQWLDTSDGGSKTVTILDRNSLGYVQKTCYVRVNEYPPIEAGVAGPFSLTLIRVS